MCYHTKLTADSALIADLLKADFIEKDTYEPKTEINGFEFPLYPVVRFDERRIIQYYEWGLLGDWLTHSNIEKSDAKAIKARAGCLNAMLEELEIKPTFKDKISNRCIIPMDGMYEWQWSEPGNPKSKKTKYLVTKPDNSVFACAGLYSEWKNPKTGFTTYCYTICTTEGNELMKEIKNEGERMLVVLNPDEQDAWLNPKIHYMDFADRSHIILKAELAHVEPRKTQAKKTLNPPSIQTELF